MTLLRAGFFRELHHGDAMGPSIGDARHALAAKAARDVATYLKGGSVLAATGQTTTDFFDATKTAGPLEVRTDGRWLWPADLAYYVERYAVDLPTEFLAWMSSNAWQCRVLSQEELLAAVQKANSKNVVVLFSGSGADMTSWGEKAMAILAEIRIMFFKLPAAGELRQKGFNQPGINISNCRI